MHTPTKIQPYSMVNWVSFVAMIVFHAGAVVALFQFSWAMVAWAALFYWIAGGLGICLGYHRLHTHRSFIVPKPLEYFFAICGTLALEGGPISWVATHRLHHQHSDTDYDPHTPRHGGFWAHMGWIVFGDSTHNDTRAMARYAPDLAADGFYRFLNTWHALPLVALGLACYALGGWQAVTWIIFLRVVVGLHATWLVNSATHMWGYKNFDIKDDSKNSWWVALLTFGEGWHNNHHAHPTSARHGMAWWEFDSTWLVIRGMELLGIAKRVRTASLDGYARSEAA